MFSRPAQQDAPTAARCAVFPASALRVRIGINAGDDLGSPDPPCAGDIYRLQADALPALLRLTAPGEDGLRRIGLGSDIEPTGSALTVEARLVFMAADGARAEVLVLRPGLPGAPRLALPLQPLMPGVDQTLIRVDAGPGPCRLPDLACGVLGRGTRLLLPDGTPRPVEALRPGDRILTRDHGAQPLRWAGQVTLQAAGPLAPVIITRGALGNARDLRIGQHSRLFVYRRAASAPCETLVQARHLLGEAGIRLQQGGTADYVALVFDAHEIVYAEGIAVESLQVTADVLARLPAPLAEGVRAHCPGASQPCHFGRDLRPTGRSRARRAAARRA